MEGEGGDGEGVVEDDPGDEGWSGPPGQPSARGGGGGFREEAGEPACLSFIKAKTSDETQAYQGTTAKAEAMA